MHHALRSLLEPSSVALVGASQRSGSVGRIVFENLRNGGFAGTLYAVNPKRRKVFDARAYASLSSIGAPVDLAVVAAPSHAVMGVLEDAARAAVKTVALISAAPAGDAHAAVRWKGEIAAFARSRGIRILGPGAFGVVRTDIGLNATFSGVAAIPGRLALVSQSGAVATAMLDFATPAGIGFSSVVTLGGGVDIGFGELLDALLTDPATDGILMYVEDITDARSFLSALRATARVKPVVVLKAGRSHERAPVDDGPTGNEVFDAALHRSGTVRVETYTQLFVAARALAMDRIPRGNRIAILSNGRGAGLLAADRAHDLGVALSTLSAQTLAALDRMLPGEATRGNPVDVRGSATAALFASALEALLGDASVDAAIALEVPRPIDAPVVIAQAAAAVARQSTKPVLGAWLGSLDRNEVRGALEPGGIANFYTPENAVEAFSFLSAYRRNQEWLLEAPASSIAAEAPDIARAESICRRQRGSARVRLGADDACELLAAFAIDHTDAGVARSPAEARALARRLRYPVTLIRDGTPLRRMVVADARALDRAFAALGEGVDALRVAGLPHVAEARGFALGVSSDATFGPVITLGAAGYTRRHAMSTMLPPLSHRLAFDLVDACIDPARPLAGEARDALARLALKVSALVCALPWVCRMVLEPVAVGGASAVVADARIDVDPRRVAAPRYAHMAIHPYPSEFESELRLPSGERLRVRPIRPEDAELEREFVAGLSERTRYLRFFYQLHELTPRMLARFTQVDYDRELALVAMPQRDAAGARDAFVGVARYFENADRSSAEFAVVVADDWQGRGVGHVLMQRLIDAARANGVRRLEGTVLRSNAGMLRFAQSLGFVADGDGGDAEQVALVLDL